MKVVKIESKLNLNEKEESEQNDKEKKRYWKTNRSYSKF